MSEAFDDYLDGYDQCVACKNVVLIQDILEDSVCHMCWPHCRMCGTVLVYSPTGFLRCESCEEEK